MPIPVAIPWKGHALDNERVLTATPGLADTRESYGERPPVRVMELPACETRAEAYEQAGQYVVERCDVLIALWDGQPPRGKGGTAEIVEWARERRVPLLWIHTEPPFRIVEELGDGVATASYRQLDEYNRASVNLAEHERQRAQQAAELATQAEHAGL